MRDKKIIILVLMVGALMVSPLYAAPKEDHPGKGKKPEKIEHNKGKKLGHLKKQLKLDIERDVRKDDFSPAPAQKPGQSEQKRLLFNLDQALKKLEQARWFYNPNDERGQGNMSQNDMLAPFGHDKDSDRKELYGNRGRVIRASEEPEPQPEDPQPEPEPEPEPEPDPIPVPPPLPMSIISPTGDGYSSIAK